MSDECMKWIRQLFEALRHPILFYSLSDILRCVKEDWEGIGTRRELERLIVHAEVHANYPRSGFRQMTTRQKYLWRMIWAKSVAEADAEERAAKHE